MLSPGPPSALDSVGGSPCPSAGEDEHERWLRRAGSLRSCARSRAAPILIQRSLTAARPFRTAV